MGTRDTHEFVVSAEQSNSDKENYLNGIASRAQKAGFHVSYGTHCQTKSRKPMRYITIGYEEA